MAMSLFDDKSKQPTKQMLAKAIYSCAERHFSHLYFGADFTTASDDLHSFICRHFSCHFMISFPRRFGGFPATGSAGPV